jgi:CHAD domain-containing protein
MRFHLDFGRELAPQVRALLVHECTRALKATGATGATWATGATEIEAVHELRRAGKRSRAWLRLIRSGVSEKWYRRESQAWRELGRILSAPRDAEVIAEVVVCIGQRYAEHVPAQVVSGLIHQPPPVTAAQLATLRAALEDQRQRLEKQVFTVKMRDLSKGHARSYRAWIAAGEKLLAVATTDTRHTWRKRGKDLAYQVQLLTPLWPTMLRPFANALGEVNDCLGRERDLALTCEWLSRQGEREGADQVAKYAQQWRRHVQARGQKIGEQLMGKGGGGELGGCRCGGR